MTDQEYKTNKLLSSLGNIPAGRLLTGGVLALCASVVVGAFHIGGSVAGLNISLSNSDSRQTEAEKRIADLEGTRMVNTAAFATIQTKLVAIDEKINTIYNIMLRRSMSDSAAPFVEKR